MTNQKHREITRDTPLRLEDAIKIAFPSGGMTVSGLRRERDRNRLIVEKIAGKEFTTLAHIERMRELCRVEAKVPGSNFERRDETRPEISRTKRPGVSATTIATSAQAALQMKLQPRSKS
ncbi:MAG: excisionase [Rhizobiales bacterium]|nr:excisionase [Hyphomicrobiales bacterium]